MTTDDRMKNPPHPGAFIRTEILEPLELSVTAGAQVPGVSRVTLSSLLNGYRKRAALGRKAMTTPPTTRQSRQKLGNCSRMLVDGAGLEPAASALRTRRSPS
jgi:hypothetical protein